MCFRKISTAIIACLILILLIPAFFDVVALAESGKPVHRKAIIVQPGEEVIVTDTASPNNKDVAWLQDKSTRLK